MKDLGKNRKSVDNKIKKLNIGNDLIVVKLKELSKIKDAPSEIYITSDYEIITNSIYDIEWVAENMDVRIKSTEILVTNIPDMHSKSTTKELTVKSVLIVDKILSTVIKNNLM